MTSRNSIDGSNNARGAQTPYVPQGPGTEPVRAGQSGAIMRGGPGYEAGDVNAVGDAKGTARSSETLITRLHTRAAELGDRAAYHVKVDGKWQATSWRDYAANVRQVAKALMALGLQKGDLATIYSNNSREWMLSDLGLMSIGCVSAGATPDLDGAAVQHVLKDSVSRVIFVEDKAAFAKIAANLGDSPKLEHVVIMNGEKPDDPRCISWSELIDKGSAITDDAVRERENQVNAKECATLVYTSGTTGKPKGVMLSHENLAFAGTTLVDACKITKKDTAACFLRLGHVADRVFSVAGPLTSGMSIYFTNAKALKDDLPQIRPTIFFAVPKVWDLLIAHVNAGIEDRVEGFQSLMVPAMKQLGRNGCKDRIAGEDPSSLLWDLANENFFKPTKKALGLERVRFAISGSAALSPATSGGMAAIDIPIYDAYGQSESTGVLSANRPGAAKEGTVGMPLPGIQVELAEDGEILVRGPNVFMGYWKNPEATAGVLKDGWLYTGDLGVIHADGAVEITGRKKRAFKLKNGEFVSPEPIENLLKSDLIADVVVVGPGRNHVGAVIVLNEMVAKRIAAKKGALHNDSAVIAAVKKQIDEANKNQALSAHRKIKCHFIVDRKLTEGEEGEITPATKKIRPFKVEENFAKKIDAMYDAR